MRLFRLLALMLLSLTWTSSARAVDEYIDPTRLNLLQTMLRFGAIDINNDVAIDDYAKITECDLYTLFSNNEFKWQKIREGLRNKIRAEPIVSYPTAYVISGHVKLEKYDFATKMFRLSPDSPMMGINAFRLLDSDRKVCATLLKLFPKSFVAATEARFSLPGFVMNESDAQSLLNRLASANNLSRQILVRFNLRIMGAPKVKIDYSNLPAWSDANSFVGRSDTIVLPTKIDSVEFFEDEEMKRRLFVYNP